MIEELSRKANKIYFVIPKNRTQDNDLKASGKLILAKQKCRVV